MSGNITNFNSCMNITDVTRSSWDRIEDSQIFCIYFVDNDYIQVFYIALCIVYIHMGSYFMQYPLHAGFYYNLMSIKPRCSIDDMIQEWKHREKIRNQIGYIGGVPVLFYLIVTALLHITYISVKIALIVSPQLRSNTIFINETFREFNSGLRIIVMAFFVHSLVSAIINVVVLYYSNFKEKYNKWVIIFVGIIYLADIIVSVVCILVQWSIILLFFYHVCCIIVVLIGVVILSFIIVPILYLYIISVVSLSSCFGCLLGRFDESKPMYIFAIMVGGGFSTLSIVYLLLSASLALSFAFLNGPPKHLIILNLQTGSSEIVFVSLLIFAFFIGVVGIIVGFISSFLRTNFHFINDNDKPPTLSNQQTLPDSNVDIQLQSKESNILNLTENGINPSKLNETNVISSENDTQTQNISQIIQDSTK